MSTSSTTHDPKKSISAIKLEAIHQPNASVPALINSTASNTKIRTNSNNKSEDLRIPKKERYEVAPPVLEHKLLVKSSDKKIQNLLCPIELLLEAPNYNAPIIPARYDPDIFCLFHNVTSNSFKATTPKITSRKRKNDNNLSRNAKKRRKSQQQTDEDIDLGHHNKAHKKIPPHIIPKHQAQSVEDEFFKFQPELNVNSRPKRQRKKVSYREPDPNQIPVNYIKAKPTASTSKSSAKSKQQQPAQNTIQKMERFVEMKWVQCDKCLKWRRIPASISDKELEGEWECKMNKWDLKRNTCNAAEESYDLAEEQTVTVSNGSDSDANKQKRKEFYNFLQQFYRCKDMRGKHLDIQQVKKAKIGDKSVDFLQLYLEVTKRGGYHLCLRDKLFDEVFASLLCYSSTKAKVADKTLRDLYSKYLYDYERKYYDPTKELSNQPFISNT